MTEQATEVLITAAVEDRLDDDARRRLNEALRADPSAVEEYVRQMRISALLEWQHGQVQAPLTFAEPAAAPSVAATTTSRRWLWRTAAMLLLTASLALIYLVMSAGAPSHVGTLLTAENVIWSEGADRTEVGQLITSGNLRLASGRLKLAMTSGAMLQIQGPADITLVSPLHVKVKRGHVTARVEQGDIGFTVETPHAQVIDRGTEFGVQVDADSQTGVVVFEGAVDVAMSQGNSPRRLTSGQAVHVDGTGRMSRLINVVRSTAEQRWTTSMEHSPQVLISAVRDNFSDDAGLGFYEIVPAGFAEDARAYVDRVHEWNGILPRGLPQALLHGDYVKTFNDDKRNATLAITVTVAQPAVLHILLDDRYTPPPWLLESFTRTDWKAGLDEGPSTSEDFQLGVGPGVAVDREFTVWSRRIESPGDIALGPMGQANTGGKAMYGIVATPLP